MKLSVHLVAWNGGKYIPFLFASLRAQTFKDWRLVVLDNASADGTAALIEKELPSVGVEYEFLKNQENLGFAGGHNQLYKKSLNAGDQSEYILLLNQDMYLLPDCLEKVVRFMEENYNVAAASPRLMKWNFDEVKNSFENLEKSFTNKVDSLGLKVLRNRRVIEKYAGKDWLEVKPKMNLSFRTERIAGDGAALEVFGVSGALPILRVSALDAVKFSDSSFFDESYNSYKEDVDLAWRLRLAGFKAYTILDAVCYHDRSAAGPENLNDASALENKKKQSEWVKYYSYKNHLMTLIKNEYWQNFFLDFLWILWYELKKFCYFLLFDRKILKGLGEIWQNRKNLKFKRLFIKKLRKINWREMRQWWK